MKDELGGFMVKFVGLRAKTYSYLIDDSSEDKKAKKKKKKKKKGKKKKKKKKKNKKKCVIKIMCKFKFLKAVYKQLNIITK